MSTMAFGGIRAPRIEQEVLKTRRLGRDKQIHGHRPRNLWFIALCARYPPQADGLEANEAQRQFSSHSVA